MAWRSGSSRRTSAAARRPRRGRDEHAREPRLRATPRFRPRCWRRGCRASRAPSVDWGSSSGPGARPPARRDGAVEVLLAQLRPVVERHVPAPAAAAASRRPGPNALEAGRRRPGRGSPGGRSRSRRRRSARRGRPRPSGALGRGSCASPRSARWRRRGDGLVGELRRLAELDAHHPRVARELQRLDYDTSTVRRSPCPRSRPGACAAARRPPRRRAARTRSGARGGALSEPRSIRRGSSRLPTGTAPPPAAARTCPRPPSSPRRRRRAPPGARPPRRCRWQPCAASADLALTRAGLLHGVRPLLGGGDVGAAPRRP